MFPWNRLHNITYTLKLSTETHQCSYQICVAVASVHKDRQLVSHKYAGNPTIPAENLLVILRILTSNPVYTFQTRSQTEKGVARPAGNLTLLTIRGTVTMILSSKHPYQTRVGCYNLERDLSGHPPSKAWSSTSSMRFTSRIWQQKNIW